MAKATKKPALKAVKKPEFDPSKAYSWKADDVFSLTGAEFEFIYKSLFSTLNTDSSKHILSANTCFGVLQNKLKQGVEDGFIVESTPQEEE